MQTASKPSPADTGDTLPDRAGQPFPICAKLTPVSDEKAPDAADESTPELRSEDDASAEPAEDGAKPKRKRARATSPRDRDEAKPASPYGPVAHLAFVIVAAVAVYSFVSVAKEGELRRRCTPTCLLRPTYAGYEKKAPNFVLKDTLGHDIALESYRGKVVVLNFWTKTCGPCVEEMPEIADLARILKPMTDVAVVTVSTDDTAQEALDTLKSVLREPQPPFPVLMDPEANTVRGKYGTSLYPETWIIDKDGVIRARFDGAREWSNATVVEYVNHIRGGGYCPVQARDGKFLRSSEDLCSGLSGG